MDRFKGLLSGDVTADTRTRTTAVKPAAARVSIATLSQLWRDVGGACTHLSKRDPKELIDIRAGNASNQAKFCLYGHFTQDTIFYALLELLDLPRRVFVQGRLYCTPRITARFQGFDLHCQICQKLGPLRSDNSATGDGQRKRHCCATQDYIPRSHHDAGALSVALEFGCQCAGQSAVVNCHAVKDKYSSQET